MLSTQRNRETWWYESSNLLPYVSFSASGANGALLEDVSNLFGWIRDLSTEEALDVIHGLEPCDGRNGIHNRCINGLSPFPCPVNKARAAFGSG